jgi:Asp-tRNA(Asn)/Glu-tRNA(Gln) amidotransferase A subunit family amidase
VSLPLLQSESGLPIGVQLVGRRGNDARLLRTANWLVRKLGKRGRGSAAPAKMDARRAKTRSGR